MLGKVCHTSHGTVCTARAATICIHKRGVAHIPQDLTTCREKFVTRYGLHGTRCKRYGCNGQQHRLPCP